MAQHSFVREALDLINDPFKQLKCDKKVYVKAAYKSLQVNHDTWSYEISGNIPNVIRGMKDFCTKAIKYNKFTAAINEAYYLDLLQRSPIKKYRYLVFAYGKVPDFKKYDFRFINQNDGYMMCAAPLKSDDVIGLAERMKQNLPGD